MGKFYSAGLLLVLLLFIETVQFGLCGNSSFVCIKGERQALLKFKRSFQDPSHVLSSWESTDCCKWKGVSCSRSTGHVVKLDLGSIIWFEYPLVAPEINSCLLELRYLNYLDLSWIDFQRAPIPKFFGLMTRLRYLNLSSAYLSGMVPPQLGNLTNLRVLDLSDIYLLHIQNLEWVSRLSYLQHLDMSGVDLSGTRNLMQVLNMLPSLLVLRLSRCGLNKTRLPQAYINSTFLSTVQYLDLSYNYFQGPFPLVLQNMTYSLRVLDLSDNSFNSSIPLWLGNFKSIVHLNLAWNDFNSFEGGLSTILWNHCYLKSIDLSYNYALHGELLETDRNLSGCINYDLEELTLSETRFTGHLPDWLGQLKKLKHLNLESNLFYGPIPNSLGRLSILRELDLSNNQLNGTIPDSLGKLSSLRELYLSNNQLNGAIPETLGKLSALRELYLSNNQLNGAIPETLGKLSALRDLDLSNNQLNGAIPDSLGQLLNLKSLDISSNSLEGTVSEVHFANLLMLEELSISFNYHLAFKVKSDWVPPFQLKYIRMRSCNIGTLPQWLGTQKEAIELDLSNASISGPMPKLFQEIQLSTLDLSHNQISGPLPKNFGDMMPTLESLLLDDNLINGTIPSSLCKIETLQALDLSNNRLSGNIPNCWRDIQLYVINLSSNKLTGAIPSSIGHLSTLEWLHLNNNSLNGELPLALRNCIALIILDLGENGFSGNVPTWIGESLLSLQILRLRKNMFDGSIPPQICQLSALQILDLADNNLTGTIPHCFGNLSHMALEQPIDQFIAEAPMAAIAGAPMAAAEPSTIVSGPASSTAEWEKENVVEVMKGRELKYTSMLKLVVNMDLSSNNLVGMIPEELTLLSGLLGLNLSHNHLTGNIPKNIGNLKSLESLDFSRNRLSGLIPQSMSALTSLSHLNLSYNNFSGKIPTGNQLQTLIDPSIYAGNLDLCGAPLLKKCLGDEPLQAPTPKNGEEDDQTEKVWFYIVIMLGFMTGLWGVLGVLLFKKSWRYAYFQFVDEIKDWIFVAIGVKAARLKRKMRRNHTVE